MENDAVTVQNRTNSDVAH